MSLCRFFPNQFLLEFIWCLGFEGKAFPSLKFEPRFHSLLNSQRIRPNWTPKISFAFLVVKSIVKKFKKPKNAWNTTYTNVQNCLNFSIWLDENVNNARLYEKQVMMDRYILETPMIQSTKQKVIIHSMLSFRVKRLRIAQIEWNPWIWKHIFIFKDHTHN